MSSTSARPGSWAARWTPPAGCSTTVPTDAPSSPRSAPAAWTAPRSSRDVRPGSGCAASTRPARYRDAASATTYSGAHLLHYGLPFAWSAEYDAELVVLTRR